MYYLNVMAGPGTEREWLISDDPQHGWVRELWSTQQLDPRLPFGEDR
jgi:5-deoxy-glucuronate isomerase